MDHYIKVTSPDDDKDTVGIARSISGLLSAKYKVTPLTKMSTDEVASNIGEGVHTGLRKGSSAEDAPGLWQAISKSSHAWSDAVEFAAEGFEFMRLAVVHEETS